MLNLQINKSFSAAETYADSRNARFSCTESNIRTIKQRWDETYAALSPSQKRLIDDNLESAKSEFRRRNPKLNNWMDLCLAEAKPARMSQLNIDGTMQRQLDIWWVLKLLNNFLSTMVVPIQVYRPDPSKDEYLAWDGQHTTVLLWLIATQLFEEDPANVVVPVNVYQSSLKAEMRANFIKLNSNEGKKQLEAFDIFEQQVFGVRVDRSTDPIWVETELKQQAIEKYGLFVTAKKFGDDNEPAAITRLQEINKLNAASVNNLCHYLSIVTGLARPVEEKEMVMMAHFFDRCRLANIKVDHAYISELACIAQYLWNADFSPTGKFWTRVSNAFENWHNANSNSMYAGRFNKEPVHGFPFLIAQLRKSFSRPVPASDSRSEFMPSARDLF